MLLLLFHWKAEPFYLLLFLIEPKLKLMSHMQGGGANCLEQCERGCVTWAEPSKSLSHQWLPAELGISALTLLMRNINILLDFYNCYSNTMNAGPPTL